MEFDGVQDFLDEMNADDLQLDAADEAAVLLEALESNCSTEEWQLIMENLHELELYGLIPNAEVATEAKKIVYKQTKDMNLKREEAKAALRLEEKLDTADWKEYSKARARMLKAREKIYKKRHSAAQKTAREIVRNSGKKASSMKGKTVTGELISQKIDKKSREYANAK